MKLMGANFKVGRELRELDFFLDFVWSKSTHQAMKAGYILCYIVQYCCGNDLYIVLIR